jgi:predicted RNA-binding Zn-ribbon protein involved in translation (DUF1610 family)
MLAPGPSYLQYDMAEEPAPTNETFCPVCGRAMVFLRTIRRAFAESLNAFQCKPCGFSTTEPVSWMTQGRSEKSR